MIDGAFSSNPAAFIDFDKFIESVMKGLLKVNIANSITQHISEASRYGRGW